MSGVPIPTLLAAVPLVGGLVLAGIPAAQGKRAKWLAIGASSLTLLIAIAAVIGFDRTRTELQFVESHAWIPTLNVEYFVGVDGLGLTMVLLTALVCLMGLGVADAKVPRAPLFFAMMLFLEAGLMGAFTALNFFHWFLCYELTLIPSFFLIRLWGGARRQEAALQFFLYTMAGGMALLLAFLAVYLATGRFDLIALAELAREGTLTSALSVKLGWYDLTTEQLGLVIFLGAFLGLAVKVPLMPLHTWLPATYAEAPTPVTMVLTGAVSKLGVYGLLRLVLPVFPSQLRLLADGLLLLSVATIVLSAAAALKQQDLKRMLAYSSINHLGYCVLGILAAAGGGGNGLAFEGDKAAALSGAMFQLFNHGLTAAALFACVAFLERRSGGLRGLVEFGGLRKAAPVFCGLMGISVFASIGLPGLSGFAGEFLVFKGVFALATWAAVGSLLGLLWTAVFLITLLQRVWNGPLAPRWSGFPDLTWPERLVVVPAVALMLGLGVYPQALMQFLNPAVLDLVAGLRF
jgi:NADH-quinone oxidoreductase subunit M